MIPWPQVAEIAHHVVFALLALTALVAAFVVVTRRSPVAAVAWLVIHFVATAGVYLLLNSQFIAAVQILVYAGAIMVLFLFVIMLLSADREGEPRPASGWGRKVVVVSLLLALLAILGRAVQGPGPTRAAASSAPAASEVARWPEDSVEWLAEALFTRHLVAFELASVVLIAAMAGVLVYTTRREARGSGGGTPR